MTLLSIRNVTMRFGGVTAVADVSLEMAENQLLGFIGPNGAGKTTLMRIITGVLRPQQGRVVFNGEDVTRWPTDRRIRAGLALGQQIVKPLRSLNLTDNVALAVGAQRLASPWAALRHTDRSAERARARDLLELVGIGDAAQAMPGELPLGFLKRLEVARALALEPELLLLDEPLAGLNQSEARAMADLIASLAGNERSVMLIEHNIREVARICPRIYVQDNGRRLLQGPTAEVMASPELHRAYLGGPEENGATNGEVA
jgi:branched-chain amino acid transport system ATP-binding protein